ncbi:MAG: HNH endonuclease [Candidatus Xenobiia bacterium LiM19]
MNSTALKPVNSTALKPVNSTALKPVNSAVIQPAYSMTPAIPVESAIPSAQIPAPAPASVDVQKCTSEGETLQEPGTDPGMLRQEEQSNAPEISLQYEQSITPETPLKFQGSVKYHEKLVVDLDAEEMSVLKDAFTKAQKESGLRDRASLLVHIAKAFLEGCPTSGKRRKPRYQIVLHRHLPSGLAWCDTLKGERPVSPEILEKALCDAETVQLDETEDPTWDRTGHHTGDQTGHHMGDRTDCPTGDQSIEKEHNTGITPVAADGKEADRKEADIQKEASEYVNEQYMRIKAAKREGHKPCKPSKICQHSKHSQPSKNPCKILKKEGRAIPAPLRKKILLRDGCTCQAPECGRKIFLTIHHLTAFALCGIHSIFGLLTLCSRCHALVHEGKLSVEGEAPHRLTWRDGKGRVI